MKRTNKPNAHTPLVITGYVLFSLLVVATLLSTTLPMIIMLFDPRVLHYNVAIFVTALTIGSIAPVLIGYIVGGRSTKTKNKLSRHFNGVLFGLLALWMLTLFALAISLPFQGADVEPTVRVSVANVLPSIGVALLTTLLAVAHVRSRHAAQDVLAYKPFVALLVGFIALLPLWTLGENILSGTVSVYSFIPFLAFAFVGAVSYGMLRAVKLGSYVKVAWSAVSVSVLFAAIFVAPQFASSIMNYFIPMPTMETQALVSWISFGLACVGWGVYWRKQVLSLR